MSNAKTTDVIIDKAIANVEKKQKATTKQKATKTKAVEKTNEERCAELEEVRKQWEKSLGRTFSEQYNTDGITEKNGVTYDYFTSLGNDSHAETRFRLYLTYRKRDGIRQDLYIGNVYVTTDTIDVSMLSQYQRHNRNDAKESTFINVPNDVVLEFFKSNDLILKATKRKSSAKAV